MTFSAAILMGGVLSLPAGCGKGTVPSAGGALLSNQIDVLRKTGIQEIFISSQKDADYSAFHCEVLHDEQPMGGSPLSGIASVLKRIQTTHAVILTMDMPAITPTLLKNLMKACKPNKGVMPLWNGGLEPLAAIYPAQAGVLATSCLTKTDGSIRKFAHMCVGQALAEPFFISETEGEVFIVSTHKLS